MKNFTRENVHKILQAISASVPDRMRKAAYKETILTPVIKMVMEKALESPDVSEGKKEEVKALMEQGYFDRKKIVENKRISVAIDNFVNRKIKEAVKKGLLPTRKQLKELEIIWQKEEQKKTS